MSSIDDDAVSNRSGNPTLQEVTAARLSRREVIAGAAALAGIGTLLQAVPAGAAAPSNGRGDGGRGADPRTRETRRFLVGPNVCEITGVFVTPDERTMFVGIQHPGEAPSGVNDPAAPMRYSSWPGGASGGRPRSSCLVIPKDDGGEIGS